MGFSTNYDILGNGSGILPEGKYECVISSAAPTVTKNGINIIDIRMVIRNDVTQHYQNKYIFHSIFKSSGEYKKPEDDNVDGYQFAKIMGLAKAIGLPSGKEYGSVAELCADFVGKPVLVEINHKTDKNGNPRENVKYCYSTQFPECKHVMHSQPSAAPAQSYAEPRQTQYAAKPAVPQAATILPNANLDNFENAVGDNDLPF